MLGMDNNSFVSLFDVSQGITALMHSCDDDMHRWLTITPLHKFNGDIAWYDY